MLSVQLDCLFVSVNMVITTSPIFITLFWDGVAWAKEEAIEFCSGSKLRGGYTHTVLLLLNIARFDLWPWWRSALSEYPSRMVMPIMQMYWKLNRQPLVFLINKLVYLYEIYTLYASLCNHVSVSIFVKVSVLSFYLCVCVYLRLCMSVLQ